VTKQLSCLAPPLTGPDRRPRWAQLWGTHHDYTSDWLDSPRRPPTSAPPLSRRLNRAAALRSGLHDSRGWNLLAVNTAPCGSANTVIRTGSESNGGTMTFPPRRSASAAIASASSTANVTLQCGGLVRECAGANLEVEDVPIEHRSIKARRGFGVARVELATNQTGHPLSGFQDGSPSNAVTTLVASCSSRRRARLTSGLRSGVGRVIWKASTETSRSSCSA
jgi:hypothetical protein